MLNYIKVTFQLQTFKDFLINILYFNINCLKSQYNMILYRLIKKQEVTYGLQN